MTEQHKTHYRKVFKSDHLGSADLEDMIESGNSLIFTIAHVKQEYGAKVAGKTIDANIAYFKEPIKPMVLNSINSKALKKLCGGSSFVEDWQNITVQLYIDPNVKMKGEIVDGVRINHNPPRAEKIILTPGGARWDRAVAAYKRDNNLDSVLQHCSISKANQDLIAELAGA